MTILPIVSACFSILAAALTTVALAFISSIDRRLGTVEAVLMKKES